MEQWHDVDVITCAAPYYDKQKKKPVSLEKLEQVFNDRIHNPPELVANEFKKLLIDGGYATLFKNVTFVIKKNEERCTNLDVFRKAFLEEKN